MVLKRILFRLIDILISLRPPDGKIVNILREKSPGRWVQLLPTDIPRMGDEVWYTFSGRVYRTRRWPLSKTGFVIPWVRSSPSVPWFHAYAGPKRDFHGEFVLPTHVRMFPYPTVESTGQGFRLVIKAGYMFRYKPVTLTNILGSQKQIQVD